MAAQRVSVDRVTELVREQRRELRLVFDPGQHRRMHVDDGVREGERVHVDVGENVHPGLEPDASQLFAHDSIRDGETFAGPLREAKVCDPIVVNMIDVGEETGDLDLMLMKIADNYDEEVDVAVASLLSLLEPFMVVILGGIVGAIVLALFLPLVKMIESVSQAK